MNGAFDVDCPRTPDGGDADAKGGGKQASAAPPSQPSHNSRPRGGSTAASRSTPRTARRKTAGPFSPRYHPRKTASSSSKRAANVGLEPEEYIAPAVQHMPPRPPGPPAGPPASDLFRSPNPAGRARAHSTEAFGGNPFGNDTDGGGGGTAGNRGRSNSGSWWREEIVDEGDDKGVAMDQYYGLNARQKYDLYGGPTPSSSSSSNAAAEVAASTNPFDAEQGGGLSAQQQQQKQNANLDSDIYQQAAAGRNAGYYNTADNIVANNTASNGGAAVVDDYSFSNVNLTSPVEGNNISSPPMSPYATASKTANIRDSLAQKWYGLFAKPAHHPSHLPPNMTSETNIAPRSAHGLHMLPCDQPYPNPGGEWHAKSPGVTFDCFHPHSHGRKRHGYWNSMSPGKKIALGTVWVAFVCIIFGVTISELKKANGSNNHGGEEGTQAQGMGNGGVQLAPPVPDADPTMEPTPWPETMAPTDVPTTSPTRHPTRMPVTSPPTAQGNIAGYIAIHGKAYDATPHPTRSPTTASPTKSPTPLPTAAPTTDAPSAPPSIEVQAVQTATVTCEDADGAYKNHLEVPNLKTCAWLANGKEGYTDRKDKNCGGVPVVDDFGATVVYPTSELGRMCQQTCALYNGCASASAGSAGGDAIGDYLTPRNGGSGNRPDQQGFFLNHLFNPKTCGWLYNDKPGLTDRKEKNCGSANYPITDLGRACPTTCAPYNRGVAGASVGTVAVAGGHVVRSYSTPSYSYSVSSPTGNTSTECIDGEGEYLDQKRTAQPCAWLAAGGHPNSARHRKEKNCGSAVHGITEMGRECPWSCREYNDCGS